MRHRLPRHLNVDNVNNYEESRPDGTIVYNVNNGLRPDGTILYNVQDGHAPTGTSKDSGLRRLRKVGNPHLNVDNINNSLRPK